MAIEIVDLPIKNGGSFHSYMLNYQRVYPINIPLNQQLYVSLPEGTQVTIPPLRSVRQCRRGLHRRDESLGPFRQGEEGGEPRTSRDSDVRQFFFRAPVEEL